MLMVIIWLMMVNNLVDIISYDHMIVLIMELTWRPWQLSGLEDEFLLKIGDFQGLLYVNLVGGILTPLKNRQIGMMTFPIYGKIKAMFQTTNQIIMNIWSYLISIMIVILYHHLWSILGLW